MKTVWSDGLGAIEVIGTTIRFTLIQTERDIDGAMSRQPVLVVIMPVEAATEGIVRTISAIARSGAARAGDIVARFMH